MESNFKIKKYKMKNVEGAYVVSKKHEKHWLCITRNYIDATRIVNTLNGFQYLAEEIEKLDKHFFDLLLNPEFGGNGEDIILSAIKECLAARKIRKGKRK